MGLHTRLRLTSNAYMKYPIDIYTCIVYFAVWWHRMLRSAQFIVQFRVASLSLTHLTIAGHP